MPAQPTFGSSRVRFGDSRSENTCILCRRMEVVCSECGQKAKDTLGNLLVAGWTQKGPGTLSKRGWVCPSCVLTIPKMPTATPPTRDKP
jgi:hypothetical protein